MLGDSAFPFTEQRRITMLLLFLYSDSFFFSPFLGFFINHFAFVNLYMDYFFRFYSNLSAEYMLDYFFFLSLQKGALRFTKN